MVERQAARGFLFVGDYLCLDFVNTQIIDAGSPVDLLGSFDDMAAWCVAARVLRPAQAKALSRGWSGKRDAEQAFARAVRLRAVLRDTAERLAARGRAVPPATLAEINDVLRTRVGDLEVVRTQAGYETRFVPRLDEPAHLLVPVAESAAELLSRADPTLVKKCQNPDCILYFYDVTKNHARRWCSMTACGNRAKVAAHYRRTRQDAS